MAKSASEALGVLVVTAALTASGTLSAAEDGNGEAAQAQPVSEASALAPVVVEASADASAAGLSPAYPGGQVAYGARAGILGTQDHLEIPFSMTSYTNEFIQDRQARSVGDVLQNDPGVRVARGFGNFQESYFIRGFILNSDDVAYNGLFSLLPRQYIATELFERVEVLRGASAFLTGANPGGGGIGGAINLVPKRAPNEPLTRFTVGTGSGPHGNVAADVARRFGPDGAVGLRVNAAYRDGGTAVEDEEARLSLLAVGLDWRSSRVRLSGDIGWQDNQLDETRTNVTLGAGLTGVPSAPEPSSNWAQRWSYSNEKDLFGTLRGEFDITENITAWGAYGWRRSEEENSLANLTVTDGTTGAGFTTRFDNTREDSVDTGEIGLRGKLRTGPIDNQWVVSAARYELETDNAYAWDFFNQLATNLYAPSYYAQQPFSGSAFSGNELDSPALNTRTKLSSVAIGNTFSVFDERVLLTLGIRRQTLEVENFAYDTGVLSSSYDETRNSPAVGLVVRINRQLSVYANYIEGLTRGDTAPGTTVNSGEILEPYVSKQKEAGLKFDLGSFGGGLAVFSTNRPRSLITADNVFTDGGEDRHQGVELNVFGEPMRGVRVLGGVTWLDAEQKETGEDATEGKRVIGVPRFQGTLGAEWDVPRLTGLTLDARVVHTGSRYANATNTLEVSGWTRLDLGARYMVEVYDRLLTVRARVDNVTDEGYWASVGGFPGQGYLVLGLPRTFMLSLSLDL